MKKTFDKELYKNLGINELILLGIYSITEIPFMEAKVKKRTKSSSSVNNGEKCTLEKLVKESFNLFSFRWLGCLIRDFNNKIIKI